MQARTPLTSRRANDPPAGPLGLSQRRKGGRPLTPAGELKQKARQQYHEAVRRGLKLATAELATGKLAQVFTRVAEPPDWSRQQAADFESAKLAMIGRWIAWRRRVLRGKRPQA